MYTTRKRPKTRRKLFYVLGVLLIAGASYVGWTLLRPLPAIQPIQASNQHRTNTPAPQLAWPAAQSAVGILGSDTILTQGEQKVVPTASTAKIITALVVLDKYPLKKGQTGPSIPITAEDEQRYRTYLAQDGSVTPVKIGVPLSEYQMLQAILLPSANNVSDTLAVWAFGSLPAYSQAANQYLAKQGLVGTKVGSDASGLAPDTVSTAAELVKLGKLAMQNEVIADIVGQAEVTNFPVAGTIRNVNYLLGSDNIVGLKTGNSDQAGGAFVGATRINVDGTTQTIITAVLGSPNKPQAMRESQALIKSLPGNFTEVTSFTAGAAVGRYKVPWGDTITATIDANLSSIAWRGDTVVALVKLDPVSSAARKGSDVGSVKHQSKTASVRLADSVPPPSIKWRLTNPW